MWLQLSALSLVRYKILHIPKKKYGELTRLVNSSNYISGGQIF